MAVAGSAEQTALQIIQPFKDLLLLSLQSGNLFLNTSQVDLLGLPRLAQSEGPGETDEYGVKNVSRDAVHGAASFCVARH
jgi:hypothetical protein